MKMVKAYKDMTTLEGYKFVNHTSESISEENITSITATGWAIGEEVNKEGEVYSKCFFCDAEGNFYSTGSNAVMEKLDEISDVIADAGMYWEDGIELSFTKKKSSTDVARSYLTVSLA